MIDRVAVCPCAQHRTTGRTHARLQQASYKFVVPVGTAAQSH